MFRKKPSLLPDEAPGLYTLAVELGVEKRFSPRVAYPPTVTVGLPQFAFGDHVFRVFDLSTGGCSLLDPGQIFGAQIGLTYQLTLDWGDEREAVSARLVGRVDHRRNFQFLDLPRPRVERIKGLIALGVRGTTLHLVREDEARGLVLDAIEVWTSAGGDSVTIENHLQRVASVYLSGKVIRILREARPVDDQGRAVPAGEVDAVIMFLANAPQRSPAFNQVLALLEEIRTGLTA